MTRTLCSALGLYSWDGPTDWEMCCVCRCCCSMQEVRIWRGVSYLYCDIDTVLLYNSTDAGHNTAAGCHTNLLCPQVGISMIKLLTFTEAFGQHLPTWAILSYQTRKLCSYWMSCHVLGSNTRFYF